MTNVELLIEGVKLILIPLGIWIIKKFNALMIKLEHMATRVDKLYVVVIGIDGKNGLRSRIKALENWRHGIEESSSEEE